MLIGAIIVAAFFALLPLSRVAAADINVDSDCSLANAIRSANGDAQKGATLNNCEDGDEPDPDAAPPTDGADTITLSANVDLASALPAIKSVVAISGGGRVIQPTAANRVGAFGAILKSEAGSNLTLSNLTLRYGGSVAGGPEGRSAALELGDAATLNNVTIMDSFTTAIRGTGEDANYALNDVHILRVRDATYTPAALAAEAGTWALNEFSVKEIVDGYALIDVSRGATVRLSDCLRLAYAFPPLQTGSGEFEDHSDTSCANDFVGNNNFFDRFEDEEVLPFCELPVRWLENEANLERHTIELTGDCDNTRHTTYVPPKVHLKVSSPPGQRFSLNSGTDEPMFVVGGSLTLSNIDLVLDRSNSFEWGLGLYGIEGYGARKIVLEDVLIIHSPSLATDTPGGILLSNVRDASLTRVEIRGSRLPEDATQGSALNLIGANKVAISDSTFFLNHGGSGAIAAVGGEPQDRRTVVHLCGRITFTESSPVDIADPHHRIGGCPRDSRVSDGYEEPKPTPTPKPSTCLSLPESVRVTGISVSTQCQLVGGASLGDADLAARFVEAVDIWSWVLPNTQVCFKDRIGSITFLDAAYAPRAVSQLPAFVIDGATCTRIHTAGTVVLMPDASPTTCNLTLRYYSAAYAAPSAESAIVGHYAPGATTWAVQQRGEWYQVDLGDQLGYIHPVAVETTSGFCG